jgi:hypothetical protein
MPDDQDNFLTRGPEMSLPATEDEEEAVRPLGIRGASQQRGRRGPMLILAVMLVFVLGGAAWFTVQIFTGGSDSRVAGVEIKSPLEPVAARSGDAPAALDPPPAKRDGLQPPPAITPPAKVAAPELPPPPPADPLTADTQSAPINTAKLSGPKPSAPPSKAMETSPLPEPTSNSEPGPVSAAKPPAEPASKPPGKVV